MPVDARMRLESVRKIYTATLILQLAREGRLRVGDTGPGHGGLTDLVDQVRRLAAAAVHAGRRVPHRLRREGHP
jgi:hypothetical protein